MKLKEIAFCVWFPMAVFAGVFCTETLAQSPPDQQKMAAARMQAEKDATEQMAAEQMKNARDWRATAMQLDAMVTDFKQQLEKAKKECTLPAEPSKP